MRALVLSFLLLGALVCHAQYPCNDVLRVQQDTTEYFYSWNPARPATHHAPGVRLIREQGPRSVSYRLQFVTDSVGLSISDVFVVFKGEKFGRRYPQYGGGLIFAGGKEWFERLITVPAAEAERFRTQPLLTYVINGVPSVPFTDAEAAFLQSAAGCLFEPAKSPPSAR